jgi:GT2 family glycosyltransferase
MIVSAIVCTRNRPDGLIRSVRSLLAGTSEEFELIVVDQSQGRESQTALARLVSDPRLRYVRSGAVGKGAALNEGFHLARGEIVACTDDDCEVPPDWAVDMARTLENHPSAAVLFCRVTAGPYDSAAGYVPTYERRRDRFLRSIGDCRDGLGLGAGMALRRNAVLALGGFDESFGPGGRFASGDEHDLCHRALLKGWHVYETVDVSVLHHGFLPFAIGRTHTRRDWISAGASGAKLLRSRSLDAILFSLWIFSAYALWPPVRDLLRLRRPRKLARLAGFAEGFVKGLRTPLDKQSLIYKPTAGAS